MEKMTKEQEQILKLTLERKIYLIGCIILSISLSLSLLIYGVLP